MAIQKSVAVRNAELDAGETVIGTSAKLRLYTGAPPANCAASPTGTLLATLDLPSDWMGAASGGVKAKSGTWSGVGVAAGVIGHFRIWDTAIANCHMQGTVTESGGGGDAIADNTDIAVDQVITINSFNRTAGGA